MKGRIRRPTVDLLPREAIVRGPGPSRSGNLAQAGSAPGRMGAWTPSLDTLAARLEADLRLRFPTSPSGSHGRWKASGCDGSIIAASPGATWPPTSITCVLFAPVTEQLLAEVTIEVADNLWPTT